MLLAFATLVFFAFYRVPQRWRNYFFFFEQLALGVKEPWLLAVYPVELDQMHQYGVMQFDWVVFGDLPVFSQSIWTVVSFTAFSLDIIYSVFE